MVQPVPILRTNTSDAVTTAVRAMIVEGALAAGDRINEVHLAARLGVSRTPLREALNRLAAEGALTSTPGHGFRVRPLTVEEFEQVYALRSLLDPEALRVAGLPGPDQLARLGALNMQLAKARDPEAAIALDDEWHRALLAHCPNRALMELIEHAILRTRRYEVALMHETKNVRRATDEHEVIVSALKEGDLDKACAALKRNMQSGREPILEWLRSREARDK